VAGLLIFHICPLETRTFRFFTRQLVEQLLRDLLNLLIFLDFLHNLIVFLRKKRPLTFNNLTDRLLFFPSKTDLALIKECAHELAALDLLTKLPLADVKQLISLLPYYGVVKLLFLLLFGCSGLGALCVSRLFLDHAIHGDIHRLGSI